MLSNLMMRLSHKVIGGECVETRGPLMLRWILIRTRVASLMIHRFLRSDMDRCLHDHPWAFVTFLVSSGYWEHTPEGRFWRRRFSILYRPAIWRHYVEIERPTWTVVLKFRTVREWGFITPGGWVHWKAMNYEEMCEED